MPADDDSRAGPVMIVSGGQAGVDRAALEFALEHGLGYGGWCPRGGWAEDHPEPPGVRAHYPLLRETPSRRPGQRTAWNARDADGTLVVLPPGCRSPGTALAERTARALGRPCLRVDPLDAGAPAAVRAFVAALPAGARLNVAGPRESECPGVGGLARAVLERALAGPPPDGSG